jgi:hypothetical protein
VFDEIDMYYRNGFKALTYNNDFIFISIDVPVADKAVYFHIFDVFSFAVPTQMGQSSSDKTVTMVTNVVDVIAVDFSGEITIDISAKQLATCSGSPFLTCDTALPYIKPPRTTCTAALFRNVPDLIRKVCKFRIYSDLVLPSTLTHTSGNKFIIQTSKPSYMLVSRDNQGNLQVKNVPACRQCEIRLPCEASILVDNLQYDSPLSPNCFNSTKMLSVQHSVNSAMLLHFNFSQLEPLQNKSGFIHSIDVPDMEQSISQFKDISQLDRQYGLELDKVIKSVSSDTPTMYNPPTEVEWSIIPDIQSPTFITIWFIISVATTMFYSIALGLIIYKLRTIGIALTTLNSLQQVQGITEHIVRKTTTTQPPDTVNRLDHYHQAVAILIWIGIVIIFMQGVYFFGHFCFSSPVIKGCIQRQSGSKLETDNVKLYIKLEVKGQRFMIFVMSLLEEPNLITFTVAPVLQAMSLIPTCSGSHKIGLVWNGPLCIKINQITTPIYLPIVSTLPSSQFSALRQLTSDNVVKSPNAILLFQWGESPSYAQIPSATPDPSKPIEHSLVPISQGTQQPNTPLSTGLYETIPSPPTNPSVSTILGINSNDPSHKISTTKGRISKLSFPAKETQVSISVENPYAISPPQVSIPDEPLPETPGPKSPTAIYVHNFEPVSLT